MLRLEAESVFDWKRKVKSRMSVQKEKVSIRSSKCRSTLVRDSSNQDAPDREQVCLCKRPESKSASLTNARRTGRPVVGRGIGCVGSFELNKKVRWVKVTLSRNAFNKFAMFHAFVGDQACACFSSQRLPLSPERAGRIKAGISSLGHKRRQRNLS